MNQNLHCSSWGYVGRFWWIHFPDSSSNNSYCPVDTKCNKLHKGWVKYIFLEKLKQRQKIMHHHIALLITGIFQFFFISKWPVTVYFHEFANVATNILNLYLIFVTRLHQIHHLNKYNFQIVSNKSKLDKKCFIFFFLLMRFMVLTRNGPLSENKYE